MLYSGVFGVSYEKKADRDTEQFRYEIDYEKTAGEGIVSVKVSSMSKNLISLKNNVRRMLFMG